MIPKPKIVTFDKINNGLANTGITPDNIKPAAQMENTQQSKIPMIFGT